MSRDCKRAPQCILRLLNKSSLLLGSISTSSQNSGHKFDVEMESRFSFGAMKIKKRRESVDFHTAYLMNRISRARQNKKKEKWPQVIPYLCQKWGQIERNKILLAKICIVWLCRELLANFSQLLFLSFPADDDVFPYKEDLESLIFLARQNFNQSGFGKRQKVKRKKKNKFGMGMNQWKFFLKKSSELSENEIRE